MILGKPILIITTKNYSCVVFVTRGNDGMGCLILQEAWVVCSII